MPENKLDLQQALEDCNTEITNNSHDRSARIKRIDLYSKLDFHNTLTEKEYKIAIADYNWLKPETFHPKKIAAKAYLFTYDYQRAETIFNLFDYEKNFYNVNFKAPYLELNISLCRLGKNSLQESDRNYFEMIFLGAEKLPISYLILLGITCLKTSVRDFNNKSQEIKSLIYENLNQNILSPGDQERLKKFLRMAAEKNFSSKLFTQTSHEPPTNNLNDLTILTYKSKK